MRWNVFEESDEPQQAARPAGEKSDLPEGVHDLQIRRVAEDDTEVLIELAHEDRGYWWPKVQAKTGQGWAKAILRTLADALGIGADDWASTAVDDLVGRRVRAEVYHKVDRNGRTWVNVARFLPPEEPAQEPIKAPAARTPAQKVRASAPAIGSDDIHF
jgi:hypothetical protein